MTSVLRRDDRITIGALAARSGAPASTIRYYDALGLLRVRANTGRTTASIARHALRRLSLICVAQRLGLSLEEIAEALAGLPRRSRADEGGLGALCRTPGG